MPRTLGRRDLILGIGGARAVPLVARELILAGVGLAVAPNAWAQQPGLRVIGVLHSSSAATAYPTALFRQALGDLGFVEGRDVVFEHRFADDHYDRLPALAAELANLAVSVIVAAGGPQARAAKAATTRVPVVFWFGGDPVAEGLVASLGHPGGNLTGVGMFNNSLSAKRLELLREMLPKASVFALLINPTNANAEAQINDIQEAGAVKGVRLVILKASTLDEIDGAFAALDHDRTDGLVIGADPFIFRNRNRVVTLARQYAMPTIGTLRDYVVAGGLMSYTSSASMEYELGNYTGRILKGEKPGDLPIQRPTKFVLGINLATAKSLGLTVPPFLLAQADEVIE